MSTKSSGKQEAQAPATKAEEKAFPLTLEEFCTRLSGSDRRVELIGAFHAMERKAGRVKDTEDNFRSRFDAFAKKPV